ncbi:Hsp20/alpha crystallin family protein [Dehalococcoides mccartyi]|uniref:Molecular chaperone (HSP20) n=2 Tax=Dehalococcoides mccartyi TaxID=61435 RepID=A0A142V8B6_9CHLR|nr:Hsp20/alpha crystallin family protein [Dehalococcoides mccartyi]AMU86008.1 molecular chaperone (HSP20) [Dehalococcoides mccartyi]AMU86012.1 molecular chaperone (HSP20) [Dehalococcoides mccartyi]
MVMQRWDPFRDLRQMDETMNRLWRGFGGAPAGTEDWNISLDVVQRPDELVVKASIPGVKPETIDLAIEDNILTLRADRKPDFEDEKSVYLVQERPTGSFYRALRLPETVDGNKVQSTYENGVLTIVLPKAEEKKKKQIKIQIGSGSKAIETKK